MTNKEAQLALANLKRYISGGGAVDRGTNKAIDMAIEALSKPEIVRCKNCQRYEYGICKKARLCVNKSPNGFCDWGERREVTT